MWHYLNNFWVKKEALKISAFDLVVTRGFGVFDFLRTYNKKPFFLEEHLDRFFNSLSILEMKSSKTKKEIEKIIEEGIKKNNFEETDIKIIQTGGESDDGITPKGKYNFIVMFTPATLYPKQYFEKGIALITYPFSRLFPEAKSLNYLAGVLAIKNAKKRKAVEALYVDKKKIYECVISNFFAVVGEKLITPKQNILIGITRQVVINLAKKLGFKVEERDLFLKEIPKFSEAFITASNKEIMPVVRIDNQRISNGKVGKITKILMKEFRELTKNY
jgi:branched-chain amino acid aminotransferase